MPVGLQIAAKTLREVDVFRVAGALEAILPWAARTPDEDKLSRGTPKK
jgi:Asp-tRNA(Asn)/Glu-tRNA(Gln) amidotransferase A subunit family amidase